MFKKNIVSNGEISIDDEQQLQEFPDMLKVLLLLKTISEDTGIAPQSYQNAQGTNLRVQFSAACVDVVDFVDMYGTIIGEINEKYPVVVNGLVSQMEEGTLTESKGDKSYVFSRHSSSGDGFDTLAHIYFKISFPDIQQCDFAHAAIKNFRLGQNFVAMSRKWDGLEFTKDLYESSDVLYYRYIPVGVESADVYDEMADLLSVGQATELWERFLQGGASWAEFETVQGLIAQGSYEGLYKWELALKLAVEGIGMTVDFSSGGVHVTYEDGRKLQLGYNNSTGAEKLFAKIIFPA